MAARKPAPKKKSPTAGGGGGLARVLSVAAIVLAGVAAGYAWRSYYPLVLPFESRLTADKLSTDVGAADHKELARAANARADKAERERDDLKRRLADLESNKQATEREMGDLQIRSILSSTPN